MYNVNSQLPPSSIPEINENYWYQPSSLDYTQTSYDNQTAPYYNYNPYVSAAKNSSYFSSSTKSCLPVDNENGPIAAETVIEPKGQDSNESASSPSSEANKENYNEPVATKTTTPTNANYPMFFTTQKVAPNTTKLSYTIYQLELLNAIYMDMKYPNSVQKTLIAKLIGITRDQVKIWFQNRRRKDTLVSQGKLPTTNGKQGMKRKSTEEEDLESTDNENNSYEIVDPTSSTGVRRQAVDTEIIKSVLSQLRVHQNAPSRLSTKRVKLSKNDSPPNEINSAHLLSATSNLDSSQSSFSGSIYNRNESKSILTTAQSTGELTKVSPSFQDQSSSSFVVTSSSSSSSNFCTTSSSSSSEDEINSKNYFLKEQPKMQVLAPAMTIQDYVNTRYTQSSYNKYPTIHNQPQSQPQSLQSQLQPTSVDLSTHSSYHQSSYKVNDWSIGNSIYQPFYPIKQSMQSHVVQQTQHVPLVTPQTSYVPDSNLNDNYKYDFTTSNPTQVNSYLAHQPVHPQASSYFNYENYINYSA